MYNQPSYGGYHYTKPADAYQGNYYNPNTGNYGNYNPGHQGAYHGGYPDNRYNNYGQGGYNYGKPYQGDTCMQSCLATAAALCCCCFMCDVLT